MPQVVSSEDKEVTLIYLELLSSHPGLAYKFYKLHHDSIDRVYQWHHETIEKWKAEKMGKILGVI